MFRPLLEELRRQIEGESGVAANITAAQVIDLLQHGQIRQALAAAGDHRVLGAPKWVALKMMKMYGAEDEIFRLAAFIKARSDGLSDQAAGKFARESFLNYDIRAPWVNAMRRTAWPIFAFQYRAAPMLARIAADKPYKVLKYHILSAMLTGMSYGMRAGVAYLTYGLLFGDGDDEGQRRRARERALLPDDKAGNVLGVLSPKLVRLPMDDRNGNPMMLDIRRWVPGGDIVDMGQSNAMIPVPPMLQPGGPAVLLGEFFGNKSWFTGQDVVNDIDDPSERVEKTADWLWKGVMPNAPWIPGSYSYDSIRDAVRGRTVSGPSGQEKASVAQSLMSAVGVKVESYPIDSLAYNARAKFAAERAKVMSDTAKEFRRIEHSGNEREDADKQAERDAKIAASLAKLQRRSEELTKKLQAAGVD